MVSTSLLGLFIGMLIVEYLEVEGIFNAGAKIYRIILPLQLLWGTCGFLINENFGNFQADFGEGRLWYYCSLVLGMYYATLMASGGKVGNAYERGGVGDGSSGGVV